MKPWGTESGNLVVQKMQITVKGKKKGRFMAYFFQQSQFCAGYKLNPHSDPQCHARITTSTYQMQKK